MKYWAYVYLFLIIYPIFGKDLDLIFTKYKDMLNNGYIECKLDTLLHLSYGDEYNQLTPNKNWLYCGPPRFDLDDSSIYVYNYDYLYKYNWHTDTLIWRNEMKLHLLNFKYYKGQLFVYYKDKLSIHDATTMRLLKEIPLKELKVNIHGAVNVCFYYDKYLFLFDYDSYPIIASDYLAYIYDMERDIFIDKREEKLKNYYPFTNCDNCNRDFCLELCGAVDSKYLVVKGQSDGHILFSIGCSLEETKYCPEKYFYHFGVYNKQKNSYSIFKNKLDSEGYKINILSKDTIHFINDTTFVYQSWGNQYSDIKEVYYIKAIFRGW